MWIRWFCQAVQACVMGFASCHLCVVASFHPCVLLPPFSRHPRSEPACFHLLRMDSTPAPPSYPFRPSQLFSRLKDAFPGELMHCSCLLVSTHVATTNRRWAVDRPWTVEMTAWTVSDVDRSYRRSFGKGERRRVT